MLETQPKQPLFNVTGMTDLTSNVLIGVQEGFHVAGLVRAGAPARATRERTGSLAGVFDLQTAATRLRSGDLA
jgi:hypothetical protein